MRPVIVLLLALASAASGQLTDLQPGVNFPTAAVALGGAERTENVDAADVDNDGDLDVVIANGGDGAPQPNRIFINQGGRQGGVEGVLVEETATRFAGLPADRSRDVEFVDLEGDGDLDLFIANRGDPTTGEVSRAYINQGGLQGGAVGFFSEGTTAFWGNLVSVPLVDEEGTADGQGPWRGFSCDCDFADLDDDGDKDLFYSTYGPSLTGGRDSRVFLNDGSGRFDELWPWVDPGAEIQLHSIDIDLADFDGDLDLDLIASSRESHSRAYRNNLYGGTGGGALFTDVTDTALPFVGVLPEGLNYEVEYADMDGDGDFDIWMNNYVNFVEVAMRNDGSFQFEPMAWIRGDPFGTEAEQDFFDYDGDGDFDVFSTNALGENWLYQGGLAQGFDDVQGIFHRTGTTDAGSLAPWPETPSVGNGSTTMDVDAADLDGDGDMDLLLANKSDAPNRRLDNVLGIPDTHAPGFHFVTSQADKTDGSDTPIHAQVRDNAPYYRVDGYDVLLFYSVDSGPLTCLRMTGQGGQQFRAVLPGGITGSISYHVEATDDAGNTGATPPVSYQQSGGGLVPWQHIDCGTVGVDGFPHFDITGGQTGGAIITLALTHAAPDALSLLFVSVASFPSPFKGGTLYTVPVALTLTLFTGSGGQLILAAPWPAGIPPGTQLWMQYAIDDAAHPSGTSLSNAVLATQT